LSDREESNRRMKRIDGIVCAGNGAAGDRFRVCQVALARYGLKFPPLHLGTVNIKIEEAYSTPYYGIIVPFHELDEISLMNKEYWQFIPIAFVNSKKRMGYILRTSCNIHGEKVIELVAEHLGSEVIMGNRIVVDLP